MSQQSKAGKKIAHWTIDLAFCLFSQTFKTVSVPVLNFQQTLCDVIIPAHGSTAVQRCESIAPRLASVASGPLSAQLTSVIGC